MRPEFDNILMIVVDDLNDWISPLQRHHPQTVTPNFERLAKRGVTFQNAFTPSPACSPARTAALFGQAPWKTGLYFNDHKHWDYYAPGSRKSLVSRIKSAGFETYGAGKIFHGNNRKLDPFDWNDYHIDDEDSFPPVSKAVKGGAFKPIADFGPLPQNSKTWDDRSAEYILGKITKEARGAFWGLGLYATHLPYHAPPACFEKIPQRLESPPGLSPMDEGLDALPRAAKSLARRTAFVGERLAKSDEYQSYLRAYLATISYIDRTLGRVLDRLEETGQIARTLIILWSDHGQQFGEKHAFRKFTLWDRALRVPMIIAGAGLPARGEEQPVSLIDLAPTILSLIGSEVPEYCDGLDLSALLMDPREALPREAVLSVWGNQGEEVFMPAFSVRSKDARYSYYWTGEEEYYDHRSDPFEHKNCAKDSRYKVQMNALAAHLPEDFLEPNMKTTPREA